MAKDGELDRQLRERDLLQLEKEAAALRGEIRALDAPWWRRASVILALTAIVAPVLPLTTAIHEHFQKQREVALEEFKHAHHAASEHERELEQMRTKLQQDVEALAAAVRGQEAKMAATARAPFAAERELAAPERAAHQKPRVINRSRATSDTNHLSSLRALLEEDHFKL